MLGEISKVLEGLTFALGSEISQPHELSIGISFNGLVGDDIHLMHANRQVRRTTHRYFSIDAWWNPT